jgi:hypothetical protein
MKKGERPLAPTKPLYCISEGSWFEPALAGRNTIPTEAPWVRALIGKDLLLAMESNPWTFRRSCPQTKVRGSD